MRMLESKLAKNNKKSVWFEAWRFHRENMVWAGLIQTILIQIESEKPRLDKITEKLFKRGTQITKQIANIAVRALILHSTGIKDLKKLEKGSTSYGAHVKAINDLKDNFTQVVNKYVKEDNLVIFIDDLDRCLPEKILNILEGMKLFLNSEKCIFIIGVERNVIANAISTIYNGKIDGRAYLEKLIQIPFNIPTLNPSDVLDYIKRRDFINQYQINSRLIIKAFGKNPRKIKRFLDVFQIQLKIIEKIPDAVQVDKNLLAKIMIIQNRWYYFFMKVLSPNPTFLVRAEAELLEKRSDPQSNLIPDNELAKLRLTEEDLTNFKSDYILWDFLIDEPHFKKIENDLHNYFGLTSLTSDITAVQEKLTRDLQQLKHLKFKIKGKESNQIELFPLDILDVSADAIVNGSTANLNATGYIGFKISQTAPEEYLLELSKVAHTLKDGGAIVTSGGHILKDYIIHVASGPEDGSPTNKDLVRRATKSALEVQTDPKINSIAFPALGAGAGGLTSSGSAEVLVSVVVDHLKHNEHPKHVFFVMYTKRTYTEFYNQLKRYEELSEV